MAEYNGQSFLERALSVTENLFDKRVVVTRSEKASELCQSRGIQCIFHNLPGKNDTIRLGTEALCDVSKGILFLPCDQILLSRETIKLLIDTFLEKDRIVRPKDCSPVFFPKRFYEELKNLPFDKGGLEIIKKHSDELFEITLNNPSELIDVDTKEDLLLI